MRPFEVGDMVTCRDFKIGTIIRINNNMLIIESAIGVHCRNIDNTSLIHIRKPRKGSKEARDIVAMLKWEYKNARYVTGDTDISGVLAEKAKSMLK